MDNAADYAKLVVWGGVGHDKGSAVGDDLAVVADQNSASLEGSLQPKFIWLTAEAVSRIVRIEPVFRSAE